MRKIFNYTKSGNESFDSVVDCALDLARMSYEGNKTADYEARNRKVLEGIAKLGVEGTRYENEFENKGLSLYASRQVTGNTTVRDNFNAVIAQIQTAIIPEVFNDVFSRYLAEVHQIGYGETPRFQIESNDLFKVNSKAEGVRKGVDQPMFDTEVTVSTSPIEISASIDWYPFASGIFDMGNFSVKIAKSFMAYLFLKVVKGMKVASKEFGGAYNINGFDPTNWGTLKQRVMAANGGMNVVAVGTAVALSNISRDGNFQVQIGEEMNKVGYLDQYLGVPLIAIDNVLVPGTTNGTADLAIDDKVIYFVPAAGNKPVKVVFEGGETTVAFNPEETSDTRYGLVVTMRVGIAAITGAKYGTVTLN